MRWKFWQKAQGPRPKCLQPWEKQPPPEPDYELHEMRDGTMRRQWKRLAYFPGRLEPNQDVYWAEYYGPKGAIRSGYHD